MISSIKIIAIFLFIIVSIVCSLFLLNKYNKLYYKRHGKNGLIEIKDYLMLDTRNKLLFVECHEKKYILLINNKTGKNEIIHA